MSAKDVAGVVALHERHLKHLKASAIDDDIVQARGYATVLGKAGLLSVEGRFGKAQQRAPGILIPIYRLGEPEPYTYLLRPDEPRRSTSGNGKPVKYEWPKGVPACMDVLPKFKTQLGNPAIDLWLTEGAKKADALASLGVVSVNLNGVYGWRGKNAAGGKTALSDFEHIAWEGRKVVLAFDSDFTRNRQVMVALNRLAAVLAAKGASVYTLHLPQHGDNKTGVDDYLAQLPEGGRLEQVEALIEPFSDSYALPGDKIGTHPETGKDLHNPKGYQLRGGILTYTNPTTGVVVSVYNGELAVTAAGRDAETGDEVLTVAFRRAGKRVTVTAPRAELATARGVIACLGARGAAVHEGNARRVAQYLIEFATENDESLPDTVTTTHFGYTGNAIVGPGWYVGAATSYVGTVPIRVGKDAAAWPNALKHAATWDAWPLMLLVGMSAASPFFEMVRPRRNPVLWLTGRSNSGKTTAAEFAVGLYGEPEGKPLSIQAGRTTWAGFVMRMADLSGLPLLIDETHTAKPETLQNVVYQYANRQTYSKGSKSGSAVGGDLLSGAVILAGEAPPSVTHLGNRNRILTLDSLTHPPLGSLDAPKRAEMLIEALHNGAGAAGYTVTKHLWDNRTDFLKRVRDAESQHNATTAREWVRPIAAAVVALMYVFEVLKLPATSFDQKLAPKAFSALLTSREENDVILESFEMLRAAVLNAQDDEKRFGAKVKYGEQFAYANGDEWYILTRAKAVQELLQPYGGIKAVGNEWTRRGWIVTGKDGKSTQSKWISKGTQRCIVITDAVMQNGADEEV